MPQADKSQLEQMYRVLAEAEGRDTSAKPERPRRSVLLVEDDEVDQLAFQRAITLEDLPYDYLIAGSLGGAKELLNTARFDVVVADINLGDGSGFECLTLARETPVILVTGLSDVEVAVRAMKQGASDYLVKDPERHYLRALPVSIEKVIRRGRAERHSRMLAQTLETIHEGVYITDDSNRLVFVNESVCRMYGYGPGALLGEDASLLGDNYNEGEQEHQKSDGFPLPVLLSRSAAPGGGVVHIVRDISERRRAEEEIRAANQELTSRVHELESRNRDIELLSEMGKLLQTCLTREEACQAAVQSARQMFPGLPGALFLAQPGGDFRAADGWGDALSGDRQFMPEQCWALRRTRTHAADTRSASLHCGHLREAHPGFHICVPLVAMGERLGLLHVQIGDEPLPPPKQKLLEALGDNIALTLANLRLRESLSQQSIRDPLTGLFNRRHLEEVLRGEVHRAEREQRPLGLAMIDLDFFKKFNDAHGHAAGDAALREVAAFLSRNLRAGDTASRFGGEEFALALPGDTAEGAAEIAERVRAGVHALQISYGWQPLGTVSVSVGVAAFPTHGATADALLRAADAALYQAKSEGRNRVVVAGGGRAG